MGTRADPLSLKLWQRACVQLEQRAPLDFASQREDFKLVGLLIWSSTAVGTSCLVVGEQS